MVTREREVIVGQATSRTGLISIETTEAGLPTALSIDRTELGRDPHDLAREILRLCRQSSARARLTRRLELADAGVPRTVLDRLELPTAEQIAQAELMEEVENGYEPQHWLGTGYV
jgi:hypothetical protein